MGLFHVLMSWMLSGEMYLIFPWSTSEVCWRVLRMTSEVLPPGLVIWSATKMPESGSLPLFALCLILFHVLFGLLRSVVSRAKLTSTCLHSLGNLCIAISLRCTNNFVVCVSFPRGQTWNNIPNYKKVSALKINENMWVMDFSLYVKVFPFEHSEKLN